MASYIGIKILNTRVYCGRSKMGNNKKYYFITGLMCMLALIVLGIIFYKERVIFCDTAYQAVYLLIEQKPYINLIRAGSVIPQLIPLIAIWLHAGLKTILVLHSVSFLIFFFVMYLIAYRCSERKMLFFLMPLYLILITNEVFYWPQSELQQGMIWLCLYAVLLFEKKWEGLNQWLSLGIHFIFILWIQFFHPLLFFPILFLVIYYYDSESKLYSRKSFFYLSACALSFGIRSVAGMFNIYEKGKLNIGASIKNNLPHFFSLNSVHTFLYKIPSSYCIYMLVLCMGILWLVLNKKYIKAITAAGFSLGYWVLIMISSASDNRFYTENMLLPLGFIAVLPIVADILPAHNNRSVLLIVVTAIILRLGGIYLAHRDYTARFAIYEPYFEYLHEHKLNGVMVDKKAVDQKQAIMTWGSGYESILISSLQSPDSCRVVQIDENISKYDWCVNYDTSLVTIYAAWGESQLPKQYFRLRHGKYEILTKQP